MGLFKRIFKLYSKNKFCYSKELIDKITFLYDSFEKIYKKIEPLYFYLVTKSQNSALLKEEKVILSFCEELKTLEKLFNIFLENYIKDFFNYETLPDRTDDSCYFLITLINESEIIFNAFLKELDYKQNESDYSRIIKNLYNLTRDSFIYSDIDRIRKIIQSYERNILIFKKRLLLIFKKKSKIVSNNSIFWYYILRDKKEEYVVENSNIVDKIDENLEILHRDLVSTVLHNDKTLNIPHYNIIYRKTTDNSFYNVHIIPKEYRVDFFNSDVFKK